MKYKINLSEFTKNVVKLFTGSAVANLVTIISLPILTRIYTKEEFGLFQLFTSTVLTSLPFSPLRILSYSSSMPLFPKKLLNE